MPGMATAMKARLANKLRVWRVDQGLTLEEVADLVGLDVGYLSRVERDERQPAPMTKVRMARRLGVPVRMLFAPEPLEEET